MRFYDVFNGDADGICALLQLRLAEPREAVLVTGVKRDMQLMKRIPLDPPADITALDISLDKNRDAVDALLAAGSDIFYVDHHYPGESLPVVPSFTGLIDTQPTTCTSLLVDQHLQGQFHHWAIAAAFGDNLNAVAKDLAQRAGLSAAQTESLETLGVCMNYNGYGATIDDLHFHPAQLYEAFLAYDDPLDLVAASPDTWRVLRNGFNDDMAQGLAAAVEHNTDAVRVVRLPNARWARRVSGVLGNELANRHPDQACIILTEKIDGTLLVSIRAPLNNRRGAMDVARQFDTGGGREAAAGINALPEAELGRFLKVLEERYG